MIINTHPSNILRERERGRNTGTSPGLCHCNEDFLAIGRAVSLQSGLFGQKPSECRMIVVVSQCDSNKVAK